MTDTKRNLHLQFKYTDRAGRDVYEIHAEDDNKRLRDPLGVLTLTDGRPEINSFALVRWYTTNAVEAPAPVQLELPLEGGA